MKRKFIMRKDSGATLIEVMAAVVLFITAGVIITLSFPKSMQSLMKSRENLIASNLASSKLQDIKALPYGLIPITQSAGGLNLNCDCRSVDFNLLPSTATEDSNGVPIADTVTNGSITFNRKVCINEVTTAAGYQSYCANGTTIEKGTKYIRIQVSWTSTEGHAIYVESASSH